MLALTIFYADMNSTENWFGTNWDGESVKEKFDRFFGSPQSWEDVAKAIHKFEDVSHCIDAFTKVDMAVDASTAASKTDPT